MNTSLAPSSIKAAILLLAAFASIGEVKAQQLSISGLPNHPRQPEVIELPLAEARKHIANLDQKIAENAETHEHLPTQISNDLLLIAVQLPASGKLNIDFINRDVSSQPDPQVFGREAPERKDDFAWENKYVAYRVYGPALEATGEITSGIDVWSKRVPNFVINSFYKHDAEGARTHNPKLSYHVDDGVGLDSYLVGPTRGCGGTAVVSGNKLWVSKNYTHLKQISDGPVRFQFELTYAPWNANGIEVTETKRITLDAGTHLNKIESTFTFTGESTIQAAAAIAIHPGADFTAIENGRILSVWDTPQDPTAGRIATGLIEFPTQQASASQIDGQGVLSFPVHSGQTFTYYAGSGWSKADMPTQQAWNTYLKEKLFELDHPLKIQWTRDHPTGRR
ncbi:DUF4861 domain-containing protein [Acidicapsa acidisoli]|uniref:DUF4861 domain-containing protein n=1 Tax=Acidicapsa acidisoli TaxID=1615681 RepID=UPI0021DF849F|nr:DUF4861 domain-containing protein [Acidicapsa acidisoli]